MRAVFTMLLLLHPSLAEGQQSGDLSSVVLAAHNGARARHGVPPLMWSTALADNARGYADLLARMNRFEHDSTPGRRKREGENLWMGARGVYDYRVMMAGFLREERVFRPGIFPTTSKTGNWSDVAHFTQMIWPSTTAVGCGLASNAWSDFLVCRYGPPGNKDGLSIR
ncbi:MAG: CAP domain-containing protein [Pseudomonadota bacterium]|nr:CAP domain-containing protein [Pseudomonadota bacterium]